VRRAIGSTTLFLAAAGLFVLAVLVAVYPTVTFTRVFLTESLHPLETFDSGETIELNDPDPYSNYVLTMEVESRNAPVPSMDVTMTGSTGAEPSTRPMNRWTSIMGREYKQFLEIVQPGDGRLTITIRTDEPEDFLIYREMDDVFERAVNGSIVLWIVAAVPLVGALACIVAAIVLGIREGGRIELPREG